MQYEDLTMKNKKILYITLGFMAPFILMSIGDYTIPILSDITMRTSVLFYIHGAINQLIALCIGAFTYLVWSSNPHTQTSNEVCPTGHLIGIKRDANASPNLSKAQTSLNSDIKCNKINRLTGG